MSVKFTTFYLDCGTDKGSAQDYCYKLSSKPLIEKLAQLKLGDIITIQALPTQGIKDLRTLSDKYHIFGSPHYQDRSTDRKRDEGLAILLRKDRFDLTPDKPNVLCSTDMANPNVSLIVKAIERKTAKVITVFNTHVAQDNKLAHTQIQELVQCVDSMGDPQRDLAVGGGYFYSPGTPAIESLKTNQFATYLLSTTKDVFATVRYRPFEGFSKGE